MAIFIYNVANASCSEIKFVLLHTNAFVEMKQNYNEMCLEDNSKLVIEGKGKNIILPPKKKPLWMGFIEKFKDPIIIVLLVVVYGRKKKE